MKRVFCFLIPLLGAWKLSLVGELTGGELILFALFPFQFSQIARLLKNKTIKNVFILGIIYLFSLVVADVYNHTPSSDYLRGWAKVGMMMFAFLNLAALIGFNKKRLFAYLLGVICGPFLSVALYGMQGPIYKYYIGIPISIAALLVSGNLRGYWAQFGRILPFVAGGVALMLNCRSLAGMTFMAAIYDYMPKQKGGHDKSGRRKALINTVLLLIGAFGVMQLYSTGAPNGWFGEEARAKFLDQKKESSSGEFSLLDGRSELLFSWPKIMSSPLLGYGSWAKDVNYFFSRSQELGIIVEPGYNTEGLVPTHSHVFGAWLEAGLAGAIFWLVIFWRILKILFSGKVSVYDTFAPAMSFMIINFLWDILFSPFGGDRRVQNAFLIWLTLWPILAQVRAKRGSAVPPRSAKNMYPRMGVDLRGLPTRAAVSREL